MHIFRVIQEAVNNAIKYANASLVHIGITEDMGHLKVSIQDNGGGFFFFFFVMGNGLRNMQQRVDELEGTLEILSGADKGTTVLFNVPLK
jgi:signal transduction histidine kinase